MPNYLPTVFCWYKTHRTLRRTLPLSPFRYTVRFGSMSMTPNRVQINLPEAIRNAADKLLTKQCFDRAGVKTAKWSHQVVGDLRFPVVAKHRMGSRGTGVYLLNNREEYDRFVQLRGGLGITPQFIYERFKGYSREYRLHVTAEGCFHASRKVRTEQCRERWKFSDGCAWLKESNPSFQKPPNWTEIEAECVKALLSCGLDFGACDVKVAADGYRFFIIEINSAPGMDGEGTLESYTRIIPRIAQLKHEALRS